MNKKLKIILFCLLATLVVGSFIFAIVDPVLFKECLDYVIDILNKPLPIIGITTGTLLFFIWRLIVSTNYGEKKIKSYDEKLCEIENAKDKLIETANAKIEELKSENVKLRGRLVEICSLSANKKIKNYGKGLENYGEERINNSAEEE